MRVGLIRVGVTIHEGSDSNVFSNTATCIGNILLEGGAELVRIYTDLSSKPCETTRFQWRNISSTIDTSDLDILVVVNGFVVLKEDEILGILKESVSPMQSQVKAYEMINKFKGSVFYALCDPEAILREDLNRSLKINRTDLIVFSQPFNVSQMTNRWRRGTDVQARMIHFPFERFPMLLKRPTTNLTPRVDLLYGGQPRFGKRAKRLFEWYFNVPDDISVSLFGSVGTFDFKEAGYDVQRSPELEPGIPFAKVLSKMNEAVCHMVTSDVEYESLELVSQRVFEGIAARTVVFIDHRMDKSRRVFPKETWMNEFAYIKTRDELYDKIRSLKCDTAFRLKVLEEQDRLVNFNAKHYGESLIKVLKTCQIITDI